MKNSRLIARAVIWSCVIALGAAVEYGGNIDAASVQQPDTSAQRSDTLALQGPCASSVVALAASAPEEVDETARAIRRASKSSGDNPRDPRMSVLDTLWLHRAAAGRRLVQPLSTGATSEDAGDVSVVQDQGDVILRPNAFDLRGAGLRFVLNESGAYDVARIDGTFRPDLGDRVPLGDDDSRGVQVGFGFPLFRSTYTQAFVNSDGNITFDEGDRASTARDISRLLSGPPRVAPFLADLDPSAGGTVFARSAPDALTVTWCGVVGFDSPRIVSVQVTMLPDGAVEMKYDDSITLRQAVVGLSPGRTGDFAPVDLSAGASGGGPSQAIGERFSDILDFDMVALTQRFYASHADLYDQLVIWTDSAVAPRGTFAYEATVANEVRGIGLNVFRLANDFGSAGRLRSVVVMDRLTKYPDDPAMKFKGEDSTLSILGQESGHRWLAYVRFRDHNRTISDALLGRDRAHWSFFFDSDASVMEGNDIEALGGGKFRTVAAVQRYSRLDQYLMGLIGDRDVPPFFWVESPANVSPPRDREDDPLVGVTFDGTRRDVLIQDVVDVEGDRRPSAAESSKVHRQAFIYLVSQGRKVEADQVEKVDRIRSAWEAFFSEATEEHGRAETRLRPPT